MNIESDMSHRNAKNLFGLRNSRELLTLPPNRKPLLLLIAKIPPYNEEILITLGGGGAKVYRLNVGSRLRDERGWGVRGGRRVAVAVKSFTLNKPYTPNPKPQTLKLLSLNLEDDIIHPEILNPKACISLQNPAYPYGFSGFRVSGFGV